MSAAKTAQKIISISGAFEEFNAKHPEVNNQLVNLARQWRKRGRKRLGIKTLFERLRWEWYVSGVQDDCGFKLNNNFTALYARKLMAENPDLEGMFETRALVSKRA